MYPLTAAIVIQTKDLWDQLQTSLQDLPVRIVFEQSEIGDLGALLERIERIRPEVVFVDISALRDSLENVIRGIRMTSAGPAVLAINTVADPINILNAMRAGATEYLFPPSASTFAPRWSGSATNARAQARQCGAVDIPLDLFRPREVAELPPLPATRQSNSRSKPRARCC